MKTKIIYMAAALLAMLTLPAFLNAQDHGKKQVKLRYVSNDNDEIVHSGSTLYFSYWDDGAEKWITKSGRTDKQGYAVFDIPLNKQGTSLPFLWSDTEAGNAENIGYADQQMIMMLLIPAATEVEFLEVWQRPTGQTRVKGTMQISCNTTGN